MARRMQPTSLQIKGWPWLDVGRRAHPPLVPVTTAIRPVAHSTGAMELYEIYDARTEDLVAELNGLDNYSERSRELRELIEEELAERGKFQQLSTKLEDTSFRDISSTAQTLEEFPVASAAELTATDGLETRSGEYGREEVEQGESVGNTEHISVVETHEVEERPAAEANPGCVREASSCKGPSDCSTPHLEPEATSPATVLECALAAYRKERASVSKARKAVVQRPSPKPKPPRPSVHPQSTVRIGTASQQRIGEVEGLSAVSKEDGLTEQSSQQCPSPKGTGDLEDCQSTPARTMHEKPKQNGRSECSVTVVQRDADEIDQVAEGSPHACFDGANQVDAPPVTNAPETVGNCSKPDAENLGHMEEEANGATCAGMPVEVTGPESNEIGKSASEEANIKEADHCDPLDKETSHAPLVNEDGGSGGCRCPCPEESQENELSISPSEETSLERDDTDDSSTDEGCGDEPDGRTSEEAEVYAALCSVEPHTLSPPPNSKSGTEQREYEEANVRHHEASVSAQVSLQPGLLSVDRWGDWDLDKGDVCSWPSTPDSTSKALSEMMRTVEHKNKTAQEDGLEKLPAHRKRQGLGMTRSVAQNRTHAMQFENQCLYMKWIKPAGIVITERNNETRSESSSNDWDPCLKSYATCVQQCPASSLKDFRTSTHHHLWYSGREKTSEQNERSMAKRIPQAGHLDQSSLRSEKPASLSSLYPSLAQIFTAFHTKNMRGKLDSSSRPCSSKSQRGRCKSDTWSITDKFRQFVTFLENSWNLKNCKDAPRPRVCKIVGHPDHPEVEEVVGLALEKLDGWVGERVSIDIDTTRCSTPLGNSPSRPSSGARSLRTEIQHSDSRSILPPNQPHVWNLLWTWSGRVGVPHNDLLVWQRTNHYPNARNLTRKDLLNKHLTRFHAIYPKGKRPGSYFNIIPTTFVLPKEYAPFVDEFYTAKERAAAGVCEGNYPNFWIVKPVGASRGRGIFLINDPNDASLGELVVVQRYITNPLLIGGYKFDLRIYVLVTSFDPLEAWVYQEGFARFATEKFSLAEVDMNNMFVHLTNSSIQKENHRRQENLEEEAGSPFYGDHIPRGCSKCSLGQLRKLLAGQGVAWGALWTKIIEVLVSALFVVQDSIPNQVNSFELFGFDLMIDSSLKVWLIEVNSSPSLTCRTETDWEIKVGLIRDVLDLVDPPDFDWMAVLGALKQTLSSNRFDQKRAVPCDRANDTLNQMFQAILKGSCPRQYGELPATTGLFERIAPSRFSNILSSLKRPLPLGHH